jgi:uncharacterized integral membrane protein
VIVQTRGNGTLNVPFLLVLICVRLVCAFQMHNVLEVGMFFLSSRLPLGLSFFSLEGGTTRLDKIENLTVKTQTSPNTKTS